MGLKAYKVTDKKSGGISIISAGSAGQARYTVLRTIDDMLPRTFSDFTAERASEYDGLCLHDGKCIGWDDGQFRQGCLAKNWMIEKVTNENRNQR